MKLCRSRQRVGVRFQATLVAHANFAVDLMANQTTCIVEYPPV